MFIKIIALVFLTVQLNGMEYFRSYFFTPTELDVRDACNEGDKQSIQECVTAIKFGLLKITDIEILVEILPYIIDTERELAKNLAKEFDSKILIEQIIAKYFSRYSNAVNQSARKNPLFFALERDYIIPFKLLMVAGSKNYDRMDEGGNLVTLLDEIIFRREVMFLLAFLSCNPKIDKSNYISGYSCIFRAVNWSEGLGYLLLYVRDEVNNLDRDKFTPLQRACKNGNSDAVALLLAYDANPNAKHEITGETPLHYAANNKSIIEALLKEGALVDAEDSKGHTPIDGPNGKKIKKIQKELRESLV